MKYFLSKQIFIGGELYGFQPPSSDPMSENRVKHFLYDRSGNLELHGVDCSDAEVAEILVKQDPRCKVKEVQFSEVENKLKKCRIYQEIDERIVSQIREEYDINTEISNIKLDHADAEYVKMENHISSCRAKGRSEKISLGLKLSV